MAKSSDIAIPRRIYHWVNLISITALVISGWYIHRPFMTETFSMDTMRMVHFIFMWIFTANFMLRVYWAFFGKGGDWHKYLKQEVNGKVIKATWRHYLLYEPFPKDVTARILQNTTYVLLALLYILQIVTGLILFYPGASILGSATLFLGGLTLVRQIHLVLMWFFLAFSVIHVYMGVAEEFDKVKLMFFNVADER